MENKIDPIRPKVLVFDVYETILDMTEMHRKINSHLENKLGYAIWSELFMQYCFVDNFLDTFHDFISIATVTLQMAGEKLGNPLSGADSNRILDLLKHLPVHQEVQSCLSELNDHGYTIVALTNAPEKVVCERMERTGLISYFQKVLCADKLGKYKPEKALYQWAAQSMGVNLNDMLMISSQGWDIAGAANAGMKTAFLGRDKQALYPLSPPPDFSFNSLSQLVTHINLLKKGTD